MLVFFRNIPLDARKADLEAYIESALHKGLLASIRRTGQIIELKIQYFKNPDLNSEEAHGLVRIEPDSAAKKLILQLNRKPFLGKRINVREYYSRAWKNDPRTANAHLQTGIKERRKGERRRKGLVAIRLRPVRLESMKESKN